MKRYESVFISVVVGMVVSAAGAGDAVANGYTLWTGPTIGEVNDIPFVDGVKHSTVHQAIKGEYQFLHGPAIVFHKGVVLANWANSPVDENSPAEALRGRRSRDGGRTWGDIEVIAPGFEGPECHSHACYLSHDGKLWSFAARFGVGKKGRHFNGLKVEAFVLDERTDKWESRGIVADDIWPYNQPVRMEDGNWITGGQDRNGYPVVAVSHGEDFTRWDTIKIPVPKGMRISFGETTIVPDGREVLAVIRPANQGVALVSLSRDFGRTWSNTQPSNYPMADAKPYMATLSTGQRYLVSNIESRDTLVIAVGRPGEKTFCRVWRIRHGHREPLYKGAAKHGSWAYPYAHELDGKLYVVYSIAKEDCGLSIIPVKSLAAD